MSGKHPFPPLPVGVQRKMFTSSQGNALLKGSCLTLPSYCSAYHAPFQLSEMQTQQTYAKCIVPGIAVQAENIHLFSYIFQKSVLLKGEIISY